MSTKLIFSLSHESNKGYMTIDYGIIQYSFIPKNFNRHIKDQILWECEYDSSPAHVAAKFWEKFDSYNALQSSATCYQDVRIILSRFGGKWNHG